MIFLIKLLFIINIFTINYLDEKIFLIKLLINQLVYFFQFPFTYSQIKLKNLVLSYPGLVNTIYKTLYSNLILPIQDFLKGKYLINFFNKTLLTPALEIYYPITSSIISITIRITGVFSIILIQF